MLLVIFWVSEIRVSCFGQESKSTVWPRYVCERMFVVGGICWFRKCLSWCDKVSLLDKLVWSRSVLRWDNFFASFHFLVSYDNFFARIRMFSEDKQNISWDKRDFNEVFIAEKVSKILSTRQIFQNAGIYEYSECGNILVWKSLHLVVDTPKVKHSLLYLC